jgi:hypothetical protein
MCRMPWETRLLVVRFDDLTDLLRKIQVLWDVMLCRRVNETVLWLLEPEEESNNLGRNIYNCLLVYMASHLRRPQSKLLFLFIQKFNIQFLMFQIKSYYNALNQWVRTIQLMLLHVAVA